jgi:hypothetical protein
MWMIPEITRRSFTRRAPGWFRGMNGSSTAHCASDSQNSSAIAASAFNGGDLSAITKGRAST